MTNLKRAWMTAGFAMATTSFANAQAPAPTPAAAPAPASPGGTELPRPVDNVLNDLQTGGRMLFKLADTNNDGQISQKEAIDAGNLMVGGFFFRADQNGDGVLSPEEAKQARESLFQQQPLLRYVLEKGTWAAKNEKGGNDAATDPAKAIGNLLDTNNDKQIQASEVRQAVTTAVQEFFAMADTNRDNNLSPTEINSAIIGVARAAAQTAFQAADADKNGSLSRAEFDKAIVEPANIIFAILDTNNDGQISPEEAKQAEKIAAHQLKGLLVPEPPNSARNLIRSGSTPDQVAPVPTVTPRR